MKRIVLALAAIAAIAQTGMTASASTPKQPPCVKCGLQAKPGDRITNPGAKRGIIIVGGRFNRVALNPQPLPPKYRLGYGR
jgi:hypothetical protein